jgi:hypothetical protein
MRIASVAAAILLLATSRVYATPQTELQAGNRLRIKMSDSSKEYVLGRVSGDTLVVSSRNDDGMKRIAFDQVQRVDVRVPRSTGRGALRGALIGGMIGAGIGGVYAIATWDEVNADCGDFTPICSNGASGLRFVGSAAVFGIPGILVGAVVGAVAPGERWQSVNLPGNLTMGLGRHRQLSIQYSLAF